MKSVFFISLILLPFISNAANLEVAVADIDQKIPQEQLSELNNQPLSCSSTYSSSIEIRDNEEYFITALNCVVRVISNSDPNLKATHLIRVNVKLKGDSAFVSRMLALEDPGSSASITFNSLEFRNDSNLRRDSGNTATYDVDGDIVGFQGITGMRRLR